MTLRRGGVHPHALPDDQAPARSGRSGPRLSPWSRDAVEMSEAWLLRAEWRDCERWTRMPKWAYPSRIVGASENQPVASNAASQTAPETPSEPAPQSLEAAMERLDSLIKQMESGSLSLEELIARYEQGVKLVKFCEERLAGAEQRIRLISRDQNGKILLEKFGGESNE